MQGHPSPFLREVLAGGGSTAIVSAFLNPVDVIKTRRQLFAYRELSALEVARKLSQEGRGGIVALWAPGLSATIARELVYSGCTKGVYPIARDFIAGDREPTLVQRVAAASATGFTGSIGANAFDVVKIRQFDAPARYEGGLLSAMRAIAREEGLVAGLLLRGCSASAPRGAAIAVGEVTTYDQTKSYLRQHYEDGCALAGRRHAAYACSLARSSSPHPFFLTPPPLLRSRLAHGQLRLTRGRLADHGRRGDDRRRAIRPDQIPRDGLLRPGRRLRIRAPPPAAARGPHCALQRLAPHLLSARPACNLDLPALRGHAPMAWARVPVACPHACGTAVLAQSGFVGSLSSPMQSFTRLLPTVLNAPSTFVVSLSARSSPVRPPFAPVSFFVRLFRIAKLRLVNTVMRQCIYPNIVYMHHRSVVTYSVLNFCVSARPRDDEGGARADARTARPQRMRRARRRGHDRRPVGTRSRDFRLTSNVFESTSRLRTSPYRRTSDK